MLKLFTDCSLLTEANRSRVFPLLFDLVYVKSNVLYKYYSLVDNVTDADIFVLPLDYNFMHKRYKYKLHEFSNMAIISQKKFWIYTGGDFGYTINHEKIFTFRLGGYRSKQNQRTIVLPSFINDPYKNLEVFEFKPNKKDEMPRVGFVGHAASGNLKFLKELISFIKINVNRIFNSQKQDFQPFYPSGIKRFQFLKLLEKSQKLKTNFIFRKAYRAGAKSKADRKITKKEFFKNIFQNDYIFCLRGAGNFSVRFYETLAIGRIPLLFDTDSPLPLKEVIDWQKHAVIISKNDYENADVVLKSFHEKFDEKQFKKLQKSNRELWETLLTRHGFFIKMHELFKAKQNV